MSSEVVINEKSNPNSSEQNLEEKLRDSVKDEFDKTLFIKAGAGAGKSTILVSRIVNQIKGVKDNKTQKIEGVKPGEIVAITFTNKAAEELKGRILAKLNETLVEYNGKALTADEQIQKRNIENAFDNFDQMQISTIHSFCNTLLKERLMDSKLRPDVEMLQDKDLENYLYQFFQNNLSSIPEKTLKRYYENYGRNLSMAFKAFMSIAEVDENLSIIYRDDLVSKTTDYYEDKIEAFDNKARETIVIMYNRCIIDQSIRTDITHIDSINELTGEYSLYSDLYEKGKKFRDKIISCCLETKKICSSRKQAIKTKYECMDSAVTASLEGDCKELKKVLEEKKDYQHALIMDVAMELRKLYREQKDSKYISNDQLLQRARKLIVENKQAWEYFGKKYKRIYVDEFQDTDHVQAELILKLCSVAFDKSDLVPGKLVVVGDAKQSIYRFRGADLPEYEAVEQIVSNQGKGGEVIKLEYNFRSSPKVIDWVNEEFGKVSPDNIPVMANYEPMVAKRQICDPKDASEYPTNPIEGVYYVGDLDFNIPSPRSGPSANETEVKYLINLVKNLVNSYEFYDKEMPNGTFKEENGKRKENKGKYRKIEYKDFLILCKTTSKIGLYANEFAKAGIPVNVAGKIKIDSEFNMNTFARVYNYLAHCQHDKNANKTIELENFGTISSLASIDILRKETKGFDGVELAYYLLNHLEYVLERNTLISKEIALQSQARLTQMVEKVLNDSNNDALEIADGFFDYLEKPIEREMSLDSDMNAVRIMNVHKSKGLEGGIVIIADRRAESERMSSHIHRENGKLFLYPSISINNFGGTLVGYNTITNIMEEAKNEEAKEYVRLEYVAATRAKEALIIMPKLTKNDCFMSRYCYRDNGVQLIPLDGSLLSDASTSTSDDTCKPAYKSIVVASKEASKAVFEDITPSSLEDHRAVRTNLDPNRVKGAVFGTVMHRVFELLVSLKTNNYEYIINKAIMESAQDLYEQSDDYDSDVEKYRNTLREIIEKFVKTDVYTIDVASAKEVYCEYPFFYFDESGKQWIHGFSDLVLVFDDHIKIIDFKSDSMMVGETIQDFEKNLENCYKGQLALYKKSLALSFHMDESKIETQLYHLY